MTGASKRSASRSPEAERERKRFATYSPEEGEVDDADEPSTSARTPRPKPDTPPPVPASAATFVKVKMPFKKKAADLAPAPPENQRDDGRRARQPVSRPQQSDHWEPEADRREERGNGHIADSWRPVANDRRYDSYGHGRRREGRRRSRSRSRSRDQRPRSYSASRSRSRSHSSRSSSSPRQPRHRLPQSHIPPPSRHDYYRLRSPRRDDLLSRPYHDSHALDYSGSRHYYNDDRYPSDRYRPPPLDDWPRRPQDSPYRPRSPLPNRYRPASPESQPTYRPVSPRQSPPRSCSPVVRPSSPHTLAQRLPTPPHPAPPTEKDATLPASHAAVSISLGTKRPLPPPPPAPKDVHSPSPLPLPPPNTTAREAQKATGDTHNAPPPPKPADAAPPARSMPFWTVKSRSMPRSREEEAKAYGRTFVGCGLQEDYDMTRKLGEGTFGEVHKAKQKSSGRSVALKRILMHNEKEGMPVTALREIKILKALKHKNVIELLDMFVIHSGKGKDEPLSVYMVFPYMDHDLAGLLENPRVSLTPSHIKLYMKQLCEGTEYMHLNHILHRDMKAANLLISNDGSLKIADFGLARSYDPAASKISEQDQRHKDRRYTNCVVTRWYRPPELLLGARRYGGEIDMWGVGCVLGEMFHRRPILCGTSDLDQLEKIWTMCGTPNQQTWPNFETLPGCDGMKHFSYRQRQMKSMFEALGPETFDLLDKLLTCNPQQRITATEALKHDYFWTDPLPADPKTLPQYEASHEFDKRGRRNIGPALIEPRGPPQHGGPPPPGYPRGGPPPRESFRQGPYAPHGPPPPTHTLPPPTHVAYPQRMQPPPQAPQQFGPPIHYPRGAFVPPPPMLAPQPGRYPPGPPHGAPPPGSYGPPPYMGGPLPPHGYSAGPPPMQGHNAPPPKWERRPPPGLPSRPPGDRHRDRRGGGGGEGGGGGHHHPLPQDALPYD